MVAGAGHELMAAKKRSDLPEQVLKEFLKFIRADMG